jgi:hypothetical protein
MEASPAAPADPPPPAAPADAKAPVVWRVLAVVLALVLAFLAAIAISVELDVSDKGVCSDVQVGDCYDFSSGAKPFVLAFGWAGGILAAITAIGALAFAARGRGGRWVLIGTGLAILLYAISIFIAQVA